MPFAKNNKKRELYPTWKAMVSRCRNKNDPAYLRYGGRGISVCERWNEFATFVKDMGDKPSPWMTLDRIDNNGNYEPSNCRWATRSQQGNNTRMNKRLEHNGVNRTLMEWANDTGIPYQTIVWRFNQGWDSTEILTKKDLRYSL